METTQTIEKPNFDTVWAALQEIAKRQEETSQQLKETERVFKEIAKKAAEETAALKERQEETSRQLKETERVVMENSRQMGLFNNRFGEVVEYMIAPNLREKFREHNLVFPTTKQNCDIRDHKNNIFLEVDIMLENGDIAMLVEVKNKLTTENVKEHIKRLEKMRLYADLHDDKRSFLGAVAGVVMTSNAKKYALSQGFFVIEPSGDAFKIIPPDEKPKEW
jgi:hypothetical protein